MPPRTALGWNEAVAPVAGSDGTMPEVSRDVEPQA